MTPEPYKCAEGAGIYRLCDVPVGWEHRDGDGWAWETKRSENRSPILVEARPPQVAVMLPPSEAYYWATKNPVTDERQSLLRAACLSALKGVEL